MGATESYEGADCQVVKNCGADDSADTNVATHYEGADDRGEEFGGGGCDSHDCGAGDVAFDFEVLGEMLHGWDKVVTANYGEGVEDVDCDEDVD